jgi:hypothetical protein
LFNVEIGRSAIARQNAKRARKRQGERGIGLDIFVGPVKHESGMKTCVSFEDLLQINRPQIDEMQRIGDSFSDPNVPGACEAFTRQVKIVEGILVQTYGLGTALAKRAEDLREVAEIWNGMSSFCNAALLTLSSLKDKYPYCGTPQLYDLALDYKLACDKRYRGVLEEIACQSTEFPKGLFPEKI